MSVVCSACGAENKPGRRFCAHCASPLAPVCPACGAEVDPGDRFCGQCASPLPHDPAVPSMPAAPTPEAPSSVAERRLVSVLFADLVGFTPYAEARDAEDVRDTLSRYAELAGDVVVRYGGTVEKFIGDAVMAVWGAPTAHEDDAERAVRAGLELVDAVRILGDGIAARAGILTGEAAVTIGATDQGIVAGDLVNTAARLQSVAPTGTVLVGEATMRAADRSIVFESAGEQTLKGKATPVPAWRALRVVAERGGRNRSETLEAPFVGRADELRLLKDLFHAIGREGRARLVSVIGPAGIGKTRLAWEFTKYLDGLVDPVWWHQGRSPAYGEGITFWALGEMVRRRAGLSETDDEATTRAKVAETVATHVPDPDERRWIGSALLALLGLEARVATEALFGAWRTFFERLAATAPVVLVFEDFHFADTGLLDFVDSLMEWSRTSPIYVVTLSRPDLLERRPDFGIAKRNFTSLYLEPLGDAAMRELLAGLAPGLPATAVRSIVGRADGMPLYAVEMVRMLVAQGRLRLEDGVYAPVGDLDVFDVPETLTALIASRLDALGTADRVLVSDAAVLGQSFTLAGLAAVSGQSPAELEPRLRSLVRREILARVLDPRSPERGQYAFVQALIREVAYNTLAKPDRKARHLAAARFFEQLETEELAGALAGHYAAAHDCTPEGPERDALAAQARVALRAAGDRASALGAHDAAIEFFERALDVARTDAERAELHAAAASAAVIVARVDDVERHLDAKMAFDRVAGNRSALAEAVAMLADARLSVYRNEPALELLTQAAREFADLGDHPAYVRLLGQLARAHFFVDQDAESVAVCDRVLEAAERLDLVQVVADTLITRGSALVSLGRQYEGLGAVEAGARLAAAASLPRTQVRGLINTSTLSSEVDPRAAYAAIREAMAIGARIGVRSFQLFDNLFNISLALGDWEPLDAMVEANLAVQTGPNLLVALADAVTLRAFRGQQVAELVAQIASLGGGPGDTVHRTVTLWCEAVQAFVAGNFASARTHWHAYGDEFSQGTLDAYLSAAECAIALGDPAAAREDLATVQPLIRRRNVSKARVTGILAAIDALEGREDEASAGFRVAIEELQALGTAFYEAECVQELAATLDTDEPELLAAIERTRAFLARVGAAPLLERLDARLATRAGAATA
jgi:class 3 adenylate cyclase/predicted ATPase